MPLWQKQHCVPKWIVLSLEISRIICTHRFRYIHRMIFCPYFHQQKGNEHKIAVSAICAYSYSLFKDFNCPFLLFHIPIYGTINSKVIVIFLMSLISVLSRIHGPAIPSIPDLFLASSGNSFTHSLYRFTLVQISSSELVYAIF